MVRLALALGVIVGLSGTGAAIAAGDLTAQTPIEVKIQR